MPPEAFSQDCIDDPSDLELRLPNAEDFSTPPRVNSVDVLSKPSPTSISSKFRYAAFDFPCACCLTKVQTVKDCVTQSSDSLMKKASLSSRTDPYQAPYFFLAPGSPEAVDYAYRVRKERRMNFSLWSSALSRQVWFDTGPPRTMAAIQSLPSQKAQPRVTSVGAGDSGQGGTSLSAKGRQRARRSSIQLFALRHCQSSRSSSIVSWNCDPEDGSSSGEHMSQGHPGLKRVFRYALTIHDTLTP